MMHPVDTFRLHGRTALVTGASSGLGRHFARLLANCGAHVITAARRTDRLEQLVEALEIEGQPPYRRAAEGR